ncbi:MAG: ABC transporter ATP-binding protein [Algiphilus sp.]
MLELRDLSAAYGDTPVLDAVSLTLPRGETGALLGPSGSGKTTLLRILAGFEAPTGGSVRCDGGVLNDEHHHAPPETRDFAMVFQDLALLPHLSAIDNVQFGLHRLKRPEARRRALEALDMVGLARFADRRPHALSGGQLQRVAVARALAARPRLLLLDEPFSSLDEELRLQLREELRALLGQLGITALLVTHSHLEAFAFGQWVGVLRDGILHQWDTPYNVYHRPNTRFVADFVGEGVFIRGSVRKDGSEVETELGALPPSPGPQPEGPEVDVLLRPDDVLHDDHSPWKARIVHKSFRGASFLYGLELSSGTRVLSLVPSHHNHRLGEAIGIRLNLEHVMCFAPDRARDALSD